MVPPVECLVGAKVRQLRKGKRKWFPMRRNEKPQEEDKWPGIDQLWQDCLFQGSIQWKHQKGKLCSNTNPNSQEYTIKNFGNALEISTDTSISALSKNIALCQIATGQHNFLKWVVTQNQKLTLNSFCNCCVVLSINTHCDDIMIICWQQMCLS